MEKITDISLVIDMISIYRYWRYIHDIVDMSTHL